MMRLKYIGRMLFSKGVNDTIYGVATNHSKPAPINVLRISGPDAYQCLRMISKKSEMDDSKKLLLEKYNIKPRFVHNATLYSHHQKSPIDKCLLIYFPQGKSYNGEDIFQLHLHGGPAILKLTISEMNKLGFRLAEPGQFTKRAFMNNKMNLLQIEGLHELIHSENQFSRRIAMGHILGETSEYLEKIKKQLVSCLAACEAFIDFQQDELDVKADLFDKTRLRVVKIIDQLKQILSRRTQIQALSNGINLVIVGKPNAGKSTIMNKMVKEQVAIVSDEPGTTRDVIKSSFEYKGMQFNLTDTAGIRETEQKVEKEGIRRALERVKYSHVNLLIIDGSEEAIKEKEQKCEIVMNDFAYKELFANQKTMIVLNKTDLVKNQLKNKPLFVVLDGVSRKVDILISALTQNLDQLLQMLSNKCKQIYNIEEHQDQIYLTRQRHFKCLEQCLKHLEEYYVSEKVDIASQQLRLAIQEIGKILGRVDCQDVLDVLFKDFCIGK